MLYEIGKYGGLATIFFAWTTLVLPFLVGRKKRKWTFLSQTAIKGFWGSIFKTGVVVCGILQILFAYFLYQNFSNTISKFGAAFYLIASVSFLLCGLITHYQNSPAHEFFLKAYYVLMSLGFLIISLSLSTYSIILAILLIVIPVFLVRLYGKGIAFEIVTIILSNFFALSIYQNLGIINFV